ncbi:hypothetical protein G7046_g2213 [Stylonectria norvegica]|nr:hypothetical protein G7046_g2213 [Stylonectria norvegica]
MLSTASRSSPRARSLHSSALSSSSAALLQSRHSQQCREFSFGVWSSYLSPELQKEGRRRHRMFRYRYMESLNRNLSWDNNLRADNPKVAMKKAISEFSKSTAGHPTSQPTTKYTNLDEIKSWSDEVTGVRPGENIEDVERGAIDHLLRGDKHASQETVWMSPLHKFRKYLDTQHAPETVTPENVLRATTKGKQDASLIDPITNRRMPKQILKQTLKSNTASKYQDLDKYEPASFDDRAPGVDSTPKYNDLDKYHPIEDVDSSKSQSTKYDDVDQYEPVRWNEPNGLQNPTAEENSKKYEDLDRYSTPTIDHPNTQRALTPEEQSKVYDDLDQYHPVQWNEPDGLMGQTSEESSKNYDDLHKYGAVQWNEPDGLRKLTPEELSKDYKDMGEYGPVVWSEPDGLRRLTPEEKSKQYTDLGNYSTPFVAKNSTLQAHEAAQMDSTQRGEPVSATTDLHTNHVAEKYEDLDKYGPVRWNEPDGLRRLTPEELSKNYDDLHLYGATHWNEPDGLRKLTTEEQSKLYHDIPKYAPRGFTGPEILPSRIHPEEASKRYQDLNKYHQYENGDARTSRVHPEETSKQYRDLHKYSNFDNAGPEVERIHPEDASKQYNDLFKYPRAGYEETSDSHQARTRIEEPAKKPEDLSKYETPGLDSVDKTYPAHPEEATKAYEDLDSYQAIRHNEPDGKPASRRKASGRRDESKACPQDTRNGPSFTHTFQSNRSALDLDETSVDSGDGLTAQDIRASTLRRAGENSMSESSAAHEATEHPETSPGLTGNYIRDFPDEFTTSWSTKNSPSKSTLFPESHAHTVAESQTSDTGTDGAELSSMDESFPSNTFNLQPALDRQPGSPWKEAANTCSPASKRIQTSVSSKDIEDESISTFESHSPASMHSHGGEPVSYKILAFDVASDVVKVAEATSTVLDSTAASTPADVLLQLSNPSKFFPHFGPLHAQGYEIVSGSGDVLVFRKVRQASAVHVAHVPDTSQMRPTRINPIDMMGKPVTGNFASPTGFVNYDTLDDFTPKPDPPFRSNIDVRREEPVFSGQKPSKERKKRSIGRKLAIGAVGIAGSAYAVGVLGEYSSTRADASVLKARRL